MSTTNTTFTPEPGQQLKVNSALAVSLVIGILIWYCQFLFNRRKLYQFSKNVPGPKGLPLLGNLLDFAGSCDDIYETIIRYFETFPDFFKVWFGPRLIYNISKPEYIKTIFTNPKAFEKHELFQFVEPVMGHGLFTAPIPIWKKHKKIIQPAFTPAILNSYVEIFAQKSQVFAQMVEKVADGTELDIYELVNRCTLDIICETAMGISVGAQIGKSEFGYWIDRLLEIAFLRIFVVWYHSDFIFKFTKLHQDNEKLLENFNNFTDKVIREKKLELASTNQNHQIKTFLELLLENNMTDLEIRDEVKTFMIGGTDTTSTSISFTLIMLAMHPEIQEKVYQEVIEVLNDKHVDAQDLPKLQLLERAIKEAMRLFPVGAVVARQVTGDIQLDENFTIPEGSSVLIGIMKVHRNPEIYPNPLKYNPNRFLPEEAAKRHPYSYLAFSKGPRACTGLYFALNVMKTILATLIRKYHFTTSYKSVEDIKLTTNIVLRPKNGFKLSIRSRI